MSLPASQYSVLDAERIERVDDNTFRCYVYRFKFFAFEICPVLLVRVEEQPNGCCIKLLSCKLEGSPIVVAQNDKFDASMINRISCDSNSRNSEVQQLTSDAFIEVSIEVPFAFRAFPVEAIESSGTQVLDQILKLMLPRFMSQNFICEWSPETRGNWRDLGSDAEKNYLVSANKWIVLMSVTSPTAMQDSKSISFDRDLNMFLADPICCY
ncbi:(rap annotation release2) galactose-binding like domain containing protein [Citrus sinensis]|nr:(rap annotation release2) galactose-binding like domain containing protein [Citrus sinensis]